MWKHQLAAVSTGAFNVVEQSPNDDDILYVTTREASLLVLSALDGSILAEVEPPSNGADLLCQSGVSFGVMADGSMFLAYTVMDHSTVDSITEAKSRVVAISIPEHERLWTSDALPGQSLGSPVVLYESTTRKPYVALTHNTQIMMANNSTATNGMFTLLNPKNGKALWTESESSRLDFPKGYGPLGLAAKPMSGNYYGEEDNDNDFVAWGNFDEKGNRNLGNTFLFQLPQKFQEAQAEIEGLSTVTLKAVRWSTTTRPVFGARGSAMYFGVTGDQLRGWAGNAQFDEAAEWASDLSTPSTDPLSRKLLSGRRRDHMIASTLFTDPSFAHC